jgi:hypothetical protein
MKRERKLFIMGKSKNVGQHLSDEDQSLRSVQEDQKGSKVCAKILISWIKTFSAEIFSVKS